MLDLRQILNATKNLYIGTKFSPGFQNVHHAVPADLSDSGSKYYFMLPHCQFVLFNIAAGYEVI